MDQISGCCSKCTTDTDLAKSVCENGWPPAGSQVQQAAQAAALLSAKDELNHAAKPASGGTIAVTMCQSLRPAYSRYLEPSIQSLSIRATPAWRRDSCNRGSCWMIGRSLFSQARWALHRLQFQTRKLPGLSGNVHGYTENASLLCLCARSALETRSRLPAERAE
jgi:hypothetical protein